MSDSEINLAIAQACGAKCVTCGGDASQHDMACEGLPDYANDLNAMWQIEEAFMQERATWLEYHYWLNYLCRHVCNVPSHATARQRAEAFLRTKGLWKGEP